MAKLHPDAYPMPKYNPESIREFIDKSQEAMDAIPTDRLYHEPYADGQAYYYVVSFYPLVLQHVPFLDSWRLSDDKIKRLTVKSVKRNIETHKLMEKIFGGE